MKTVCHIKATPSGMGDTGATLTDSVPSLRAAQFRSPLGKEASSPTRLGRDSARRSICGTRRLRLGLHLGGTKDN